MPTAFLMRLSINGREWSAVGRPFRLRVKLRRTAVALAEAVQSRRPARPTLTATHTGRRFQGRRPARLKASPYTHNMLRLAAGRGARASRSDLFLDLRIHRLGARGDHVPR